MQGNKPIPASIVGPNNQNKSFNPKKNSNQNLPKTNIQQNTQFIKPNDNQQQPIINTTYLPTTFGSALQTFGSAFQGSGSSQPTLGASQIAFGQPLPTFQQSYAPNLVQQSQTNPTTESVKFSNPKKNNPPQFQSKPLNQEISGQQIQNNDAAFHQKKLQKLSQITQTQVDKQNNKTQQKQGKDPKQQKQTVFDQAVEQKILNQSNQIIDQPISSTQVQKTQLSSKPDQTLQLAQPLENNVLGKKNLVGKMNIQGQTENSMKQNNPNQNLQLICNHFLKGTCKFGDKCTKSHDTSQTLKNQKQANEQKDIVCKFFLLGTCNQGNKCHYSHQLPQNEQDVFKLMSSMGYNIPQEEIDKTFQEVSKVQVPSTQLIQKQKQTNQKESNSLSQLFQKQKAQPIQQVKLDTKIQEEEEKTLKWKPNIIVDFDEKNNDKNKQDQIEKVYCDVEGSEQQQNVEKYILALKNLKSQILQQINDKYKGKADVLAMCSEAEIINRTEVDKGSISNFEKSVHRQPKDLCIKKYIRSAADKILNLPSEIRPPVIIYHVISYIRDCIADQDRYPENKSYFKYFEQKNRHSFFDIYVFVCDRIRQMTQDLDIVAEIEPCSQFNIRATEEMCRFLIISYHDAYFNKSDGFDIVQNTQRLTHNLSRLIDCYKKARIIYQRKQIDLNEYNEMIKNRSEFTAYYFIATAKTIDCVQEMLAIKNDTPYASQEFQLIKDALSIRNTIVSSDCAGFFKKLRSQTTNYFFACIMIIFLKERYETSIVQFKQCFKPNSFDVKLLSSKLGLNQDDCVSLVVACGYDLHDQKASRKDCNESLGKWQQSSSLIWHDEKRKHRLRSFLMQFGDVEQSSIVQYVKLQKQVSDDREKKARELNLQQQQQIKEQKEKQEQVRLKAIEDQRKAEEELKIQAENERLERIRLKELQEQKNQEIKTKLQEIDSKIDNNKRETKFIQKSQLKLLKTCINFNSFQQNAHHEKFQYGVMKFFFKLWHQNTISKNQANEIPQQFVASIQDAIMKETIDIKPFQPDLTVKNLKQIRNQSYFNIENSLKALKPGSFIKIKLISRPLKTSTAIKRIQYNQCLDGLIRLFSSNQQKLYSLDQTQKSNGFQGERSLIYTAQLKDVQYEFSFQSNKIPDVSCCGTIVTAVHNQKDIEWLKQMNEKVPQWIKILVVQVGSFKSLFPSNIIVVTIPEYIQSLRGENFAKLLEFEIGDQVQQLIINSTCQVQVKPKMIQLKTHLRTILQEYLQITKYAANNANCVQFEQEMNNYLQTNHNTQLRSDLDDEQVYDLWLKLLESEQKQIQDCVDYLQKQAYLAGKPEYIASSQLFQNFKLTHSQFKTDQTQYQDYLEIKSGQKANQPKGAWYRGTLYFGIYLHKFLEETDDKIFIPLIDDSQQDARINWNHFTNTMKAYEKNIKPQESLKSTQINIKLPSMRRKLLEEEKVQKKQKISEFKYASVPAEVIQNLKSSIKLETLKSYQPINQQVVQMNTSSLEKSYDQIASNHDSSESEGSVNYGDLILKKLRNKKKAY